MSTILTIAAFWLAGAALVVLAVWRFGQWLDRASDPDQVTRWKRERVHGRDHGGRRGATHGLN